MSHARTANRDAELHRSLLKHHLYLISPQEYALHLTPDLKLLKMSDQKTPEQKSILFITSSEFGQANVFLSTIHALLTTHPDISVHIASWKPLEPRAGKLHAQVQAQNPDVKIPPITFHLLPHLSIIDFYVATYGKELVTVPHEPSYTKHGLPALKKILVDMLCSYTPEQYMELYNRCLEIAEEVQPALLVLDPFVGPSHDAARTEKWKGKYCVLSPCSIGGPLAMEQGLLRGWWKYPSPASGLPFPLPLSKIPTNIHRSLSVVFTWLTSPRVKSVDAARKIAGLTWMQPVFTPYVPGTIHISPSLPELDFPLKYPSNVKLCGPIVLPSETPSIGAELQAWLTGKKTILICLGTHHQYTLPQARAIASGLHAFLTSPSQAPHNYQVLWKLKPSKNPGDSEPILAAVTAILSLEIMKSQVQVVPWLAASPLAVLMGGGIVANVHHGGANSYFESCYAGVPQVVLGMWYDTFDYATRAEYVGVGVWGNKGVAPEIEEGGFKEALERVLGGGKRGEGMRERAEKLGFAARVREGRDEAAGFIAGLAGVN